MSDLVIYGSPVSPFVRKVEACGIEKGADYELEAVNVFDPPDWFRDISPMKRIPVMRDRAVAEDGRAGTLADSSAICAFFEKRFPDPSLYPLDAHAHGRALWIEEYADTALAPACGLGIFRPIFFSIQQGKQPDLTTARETWSDTLPPILTYLDDELRDAPFYAGDALSIADIAVTCCLMQASLVADAPLDDYPRLAAHQERMRGRESISRPFDKARGYLQKAVPELHTIA